MKALIALLLLCPAVASAMTKGVPPDSCGGAIAGPYVSLEATPEAWWGTHQPWSTLRHGRWDTSRPDYTPEQVAVFRREFRIRRAAPHDEIAVAAVNAEYQVATREPNEVTKRALVKSVLAKLILINEAQSANLLKLPPNKSGSVASLLGNVAELWMRMNGLPIGRSEHRGRSGQGTYRGYPISLEGAAKDPFPLRRQIAEVCRRIGIDVSFHFVPGATFIQRTGSTKSGSLTEGDQTFVTLTLESLLNLELNAAAMRQTRRALESIRHVQQGKITAYDGTFYDPKNLHSRNGVRELGDIFANNVGELPPVDAPPAEIIDAMKQLGSEFAHELLTVHEIGPRRFEVRKNLWLWLSLFASIRTYDGWNAKVLYVRDGIQVLLTAPETPLQVSVLMPLDQESVVVGFPHPLYAVSLGDDSMSDVVRGYRSMMQNRPRSQSTVFEDEDFQPVWRILQDLARRLDYSWAVALNRVEQRTPLLERLKVLIDSGDTTGYPALREALAMIDDPALQRRSLRGITTISTDGAPVGLPAGPADGMKYPPMYYVAANHQARTGRDRNSWVELIAMDAVMHTAAANGWWVRDVSRDQHGIDVVLEDLKTGEEWYVEVKGRGPNSPDIDLTTEEVETALQHPNRWLLAIVTVDENSIATLHWRHRVPLQPMQELESRRVLSVERVLALLPSVQLPLAFGTASPRRQSLSATAVLSRVRFLRGFMRPGG